MSVLAQIGWWLVRKIGAVLLIVVVGLILGGLYLFLQDEFRTEARRQAVIDRLRTEVAELEARAAAWEAEIQALHEQFQKEQHRVEIARRLLASYEAMNSFWDWLFGAGVDRNELAARRARASGQEQEGLQKVEVLTTRIRTLSGDRAQVVDDLVAKRTELADLEQSSSSLVRYVHGAWFRYRGALAVAVLGFLFGPSLWKLTAFYGVAPLIVRAGSIRLAASGLPRVSAGPSRVSEALTLRPGEAVFLRERFLQASDETLRRKTRFVLDWRIPITCAACGLIELVELRNNTPDKAGVTVSTQDDTSIELAVVEVPAGAALVLRPSFLAGVRLGPRQRLRIRRHWRLFHIQSWLTLQFRFFEFVGPCGLFVAGARGVRAERLDGVAMVRAGGRRTNQESTVGFTPDLAYRAVRAETFWSYYRGMNPLFDDLFQGRGTFLCQEVARGGAAAGARRFWSALWDALLKVFGL